MKDENLELINKRRNALRLKVAVAVAGAGAGAGAVGAVSTVAVAKSDKVVDLLIRFIDFIENRQVKETKITVPSRYKFLKLSEILFSAKTQKEVFLVTMADWDEEIYQALKENKDSNLFMINVRNTYAFLKAMWLKSPIGDLIEFVRKVAKP